MPGARHVFPVNSSLYGLPSGRIIYSLNPSHAGPAALAAPTGLTVTRQLQLFDIPLMTLVALACVPVFLTGRRISRLEGGLGVSAYMIYLIWLVLFRA